MWMPIISCYPKYNELDTLISNYGKAKRLNLFLDLKNSLGLLYVKNFAENMMGITENTDKPNSMVFISWIDWISYHYRYFMQKGIDFNIYTFADVGEYQYHKSIYKEYKSKRSITKKRTTSDICENDDLHKVVLKNIETIMKATRKFYHTYGTYLSFCESDFVPEYFIKNRYSSEDNLNIIYSSDRDMIQTLKYHNTVLFMRKSNGTKEYLNYNTWINNIFDDDKHRELFKDIPVENYIYLKSIMGDLGDDISGIGGMGPIKAAAFIDSMHKTEPIKDINHVIEFASKHKDDPSTTGTWAKNIDAKKDILYRNYRLMSFEELMQNLSIPTLKELERIDTKLTLEQTVDTIKLVQEKVNPW